MTPRRRIFSSADARAGRSNAASAHLCLQSATTAHHGRAMRLVPSPGGALLLFVLLLAARWAAPAIDLTAQLNATGDDPVAASTLLLRRTVDPDTLGAAIDEAVRAGDVDLAESLVDLSDRLALPV